ncbi:SMI1/KNR4 family protein [Actinomadura sp. WMMB 499]|uniref:SMI1/KNR4 family protein n=1 Tax=Actinomadura sp. WMMB 499 TaxID=1219491 RepID=UPI001243A71A|nr:SMI1/KNR4 family protein [Actinomadura sp. WMMB 499]QFG22031.1 hypothetical protein F7P10_13765 [Actinomadura sp. WMMB 499]
MTSLRRMLEIIGEPVEVSVPIDWGALERRFGSRLPADYVELCNRYPTLRVDNFLGIFHPTADADDGDLVSWVDDILGGAEELVDEFPALELVPYPLHPERGGLLPWGVTDNSDHLFWRTGGDPDAWTVVVAGHSYGKGAWWEFDGSLTDFIVGSVDRRVVCPVLDSDFPSPDAAITQVPLSS